MTRSISRSTIEHMCASPARRPNQVRIAEISGVDRSTVARVLNRDPAARIGAATRAKVLSVAARLGYDFASVRRIHRRASERIDVDVPVKIAIHSRGGSHTEGTARVSAINAAGLRLEKIRCRPATLPLAPCNIRIAFATAPLDGIFATCVPVHLTHGRSLSIGARFTRLSRANRQRLLLLLRRSSN